MSTADVILSVAKKEFEPSELIELYCIDPAKNEADQERYVNEIIHEYSKLKVSRIEKRIDKAIQIMQVESDETRLKRMIEKINSWQEDILWWKSFIA